MLVLRTSPRIPCRLSLPLACSWMGFLGLSSSSISQVVYVIHCTVHSIQSYIIHRIYITGPSIKVSIPIPVQTSPTFLSPFSPTILCTAYMYRVRSTSTPYSLDFLIYYFVRMRMGHKTCLDIFKFLRCPKSLVTAGTCLPCKV